MMIIEYVQAALLIISAFLIIISAIGIVTLSDDTKNKVYARIHILGLFDMACVLVMIAVGMYLLAAIYFIIAPFTAHAISNAYWKSEDRENNEELNNVVEEVDYNNPFIHPRDKIQPLESEDSQKMKTDGKFSVSTFEIDEGE